MTIKIRFPEDAGTRDMVFTPNETGEHVVVYQNRSGNFEFLVPFNIDMKKAVQQDMSFEIEILEDKRNISTSIMNLSPLNATEKQLNKMKMLPGQRNHKSKNMQRIKNRNETRERRESFEKSSSDPKANFERSSKQKNIRNKNRSSEERLSNNKTLINNIHDGTKYKIDALKINRSNVKKTKKLDYTKNISNSVARDIKKGKKSDAELFGVKDKYILGKPRNPGVNVSSKIINTNIGIGSNSISNKFDSEKSTAALNSFNSKDNSENSKGKIAKANSPRRTMGKNQTRKKDVKRKMQNSYLGGEDPAKSFEGVPTHRSAKKQKTGTKPQLGVRSTGKKATPLKDLNIAKALSENKISKEIEILNAVVRNSNDIITGGKGGPGSFNIQRVRPPQDYPFVYKQKDLTTRETVYFKYVLNQNDMSGGKILLSLVGKSRRGLTVVRKNYTLRAQLHLQKQLAIPEHLPSLRVISSKGKNFATIEVTNKSSVTIGYRVFRKAMVPNKNIDEVVFEEVLKGSVRPKSNDRQRIRQNFTANCMYRMVYSISSSGATIEYSNYSDDTVRVKDKGRSSRDSKLFARTNAENNSLSVTVSKIPPDAVRAKLVKTRIHGNYKSKTSKMISVKNKDAKEVSQIIDISALDDNLTFEDYDVKEGKEYEYQVEFELARGTKVKSNSRVRDSYYKKEGIANLNFTNVKSGNPLLKQQVKLNMTSEKTVVDNLIDKLTKDSDQNLNLYKEDLEKVKNAAKSEVRSKVTLFNKTTGESEFLGDFKSGADIGKANLKKNCEYAYKVEPYEFSPSEVIKKVTKILSEPKNLKPSTAASQFSSLRLSALSDIKKKKSKKKVIKKNPTKFFSKRRSKRGSIEPADRSSNRAVSVSKTDFIDLQKLGDTTYLDFSTSKPFNFSAVPLDIYISPMHNVILTFKVTGDVSDIDFYVISAKKEGEFLPVGSAHCIKEDNVINYLDYTNFDHQGIIDYYVQAIFEDGSIGEKFFVGRAVLINKFDKPNLLNVR